MRFVFPKYCVPSISKSLALPIWLNYCSSLIPLLELASLAPTDKNETIMAKLVVISEEMKDRTFELTDDKITVGRLPDNLLRLENNAVSSHHAELTRKGDDYVVRDLNSTNGTRVNGQRVIEIRLYHGDMIHFGHLQLQYLSSARAAPQPLPMPNRKTVDLSASTSGVSGLTATTGAVIICLIESMGITIRYYYNTILNPCRRPPPE